MTFSQVLEVAIGLLVVYYVLGSIVSWITKFILELQETRGQILESYLKKLAGEKTVDFVLLPQLQALRPIRYTSPLAFLRAAPQAVRLEKVPVEVLVDAFFDFTGLTGRPDADPQELKKLIAALPPSEARETMLRWIDQGVNNVSLMRSRAHAYFTGLLNQVADTFKAQARRVVILLSVGVTLLLGTDSIQLADDLWRNAELRAITAGQAQVILQEGEFDFDALLRALDELSIVKLGWWQLQDALPKDADALAWAKFLFLKALGLSITAIAVSQGSSFWYDVFKKLTGSPTPPKTPANVGEEAVG